MKKYIPFIALYVSLLLFMGFYWLVATACPETHLYYMMGEFGVPEVMTAICFLGAAIIAGLVLRHHKHMTISAVLFFAGLALFFFVCAGEEMSWGQHLLGFKTPEQIAEINEQGEFNLHNMDLEHIHPKDIVSWFMKIYGIILPLILIIKLKPEDSAWRRYLSRPILIPAFLIPEAINLIQKPFDKTLLRKLASMRDRVPDLHAYLASQAEEVSEMYWAAAILAAMICIYVAWARFVRMKQSS